MLKNVITVRRGNITNYDVVVNIGLRTNTEIALRF
jgi:hypothetical protein